MPLTWLEERLLGGIIKYIAKRGRNTRMNFLKYLPLILRFKNVSDVYQEEAGQGKPWYLSRRFIGIVITIIFVAVTMNTGITLDEALSLQLADHLVSLITAGIALYGIVLGIIGHVKRTKP